MIYSGMKTKNKKHPDHRICRHRDYHGIFRPVFLPGKKKDGERTGMSRCNFSIISILSP